MTSDPIISVLLMVLALCALFVLLGFLAILIDQYWARKDLREANSAGHLEQKTRRVVEQDRSIDWIERKRADAVAARERARKWC
jgi:hypothetical protein